MFRREQEEKQRRVKQTDALLQATVERLSRGYTPELVGESAREDLLALKPHLEDALTALEDIEGWRSLTEEELARRRAFRMALAATR